jgi:hypothetical protein
MQRGEKSCLYWNSNCDRSAAQPVASRYCGIPEEGVVMLRNLMRRQNRSHNVNIKGL